MGAKDSKPCCISNEDSLKRVTDSELRRLKDAFKRASNLNGIITRQAFIREVLGEFVPLKLAEHIFQACGGTSKGITFKDLLCGLVLLTRGKKEEKVRFIYNLYANETGTYVYKNDMVKLVLACDGGFIPEAVADCFIESEKVTYEEFRDWLVQHEDATSLTRWLLSDPCTVSLSNDLETPTFYQTLAGVTHLEETDIIELEKRYWLLKTQSRTGKFDLETIGPLISPPIPTCLCQGIFNAFDENLDGHIDFKEMACGISACCRGPLTERQKFCFKVFDQDMDGMLSRDEVRNMLRSLSVLQLEDKNKEELPMLKQDLERVLEEIFEKHDSNKDGAITLDEYLVWTVSHNLTLSLLNLMFQVCHVVFGLRPSFKEEEGEIIRGWLQREEARGLDVGQMFYLIAIDWWKSWNDYIDYKANTFPSANLKLSNKMQKKVDSSVARSSLEDGNVVLASITNLTDAFSQSDLVTAFEATPSSISSSPKKSTLQPPESSRPPSLNPSPNLTRRNIPSQPQRPPSIDNSALIVPNSLKAMILTGEGGRLRRNVVLQRGRDFEIVPEAVWRALSQWYGGSPALPRQVIKPRGCSEPELELYPIMLKLFRHQAQPNRPQPNSWTTVVGSVASAYVGNAAPGHMNTMSLSPKRYLAYLASFSRVSTLHQVFDFLCARLRLRQEDARLWLYKDDNNLILLEDEELTLEQLGIEDGEQILIEVRNKDQTWPEEMSCIINSRSDQKNQGPTERGATGLNNLGNTCFMNAALQCVSNTRPLTQYFIFEKHLYELNRMNPLGMKGHIAKRYGDLVHDLWSGTSKTVAPLKLRWTIGKYAPRFNGFQQHDSQELLAFLMDGLHEDLNRVHIKPYVELKDSDGRPDEEVANEAWENHILRNKSIIVDLFHGQLQSTVTCKVCGHTSVRFDPFNFLSLPLPMESCIHIEVVVIRLDGSIPTKYGLRLNHDDKYSSVKIQLSNLCQLSSQQMVLAEVAGAVIKSLLSDEHKIRTGGCLFAYEVPLITEVSSDEDIVLHKEPQTFTQIQRMTLTGSASVVSRKSNTAINGDLQDENSLVLPNRGFFRVGSDAGSDTSTSQGPSSEGLNSLDRPDTPVSVPSNNIVSSWNGIGPYPLVDGSNNGSMSSSLISNSSAVDLSEFARKNFIITYHRKMIRQDVYFLSSQKTRPTLFGLPLVLPCHDMTTHQDLYRLVWTQVARLVSPLPPTETTVPNHAQDCDDSLGYEYPFTLKAVQKDGLMCAWCPWYKFCRGCRIECCDADFNFSSAYISIDWDPTALHLRYQASQERVFNDHPSVEKTRQQRTEPISLHDCLEAFTHEEQLGEEEKYYCSRCKQHQLASKKLQIYRLPPILIIHLKRFQLLNGRWVKSQKIVRFPFMDFDPTEYLAPVPRKAALACKQQKDCKHNPLVMSTGDSCVGSSPAPRTQNYDGSSLGSRNNNNNNNNNFENSHPVSSPNRITPGERKKVLNGGVVSSHPLSEDYGGSGEKPSLENASVHPLDHHKHRLHPGHDPLNLKYSLYALACHTGILGGGHYVSYACNPNNKWYWYNDSSCKEVQQDQIDADAAYMLFYEREGVNYEAYMPNTEGKIPDTKDIDDEFESDFRKMCVLQ